MRERLSIGYNGIIISKYTPDYNSAKKWLVGGISALLIGLSAIGFKIYSDERAELEEAYRALREARAVFQTEPDKASTLVEKANKYVIKTKRDFSRSHHNENPIFVKKEEITRLEGMVEAWNNYLEGQSIKNRSK
jgi:hypothetical protein